VVDLDVRWKQRLQSYARALALLEDALKDGPQALNPLEKEGTVQRFEFTLELGWNLLKDYLEASGSALVSVTPKSVINSAFSARLLPDAQIWIDMLQWRNWLSHRYDETLLEDGVQLIHQQFLPAFQNLRTLVQGLSA
jgi:nucleotidyltransferase substrate binding protein (TIGR01987 family)